MSHAPLDFTEFYQGINSFGGNSILFTRRTISNFNNRITTVDFHRNLLFIEFADCKFFGEINLFDSLKKSDLRITFNNCTFEGSLQIQDCEFEALCFFDTNQVSNKFEIYGNKFNFFFFKNRDRGSSIELIGNIEICNNVFYEKVDIQNLNHVSGSFEFIENVLETSKRKPSLHTLKAAFNNSKFHNANFSMTNFGKEVGFDQTVLTGEEGLQNFNDCHFGRAYFNQTDFGSYALFNGSNFHDTVILNGCSGVEKTIVDFSGCNFENDVYFHNIQFRSLTIVNSTFKQKTVFKNVEFENIDLSGTLFEKTCSFDDLKILNVGNCGRRTLRSIKQQLQKTENRIDYNRFKIYELDAYKNELTLNQWKEKFILRLNSISSKHGTDWFKGVLFTLICGGVFYTLYFIAEYHSQEFQITCDSLNFFLKGFFKFLLPSYTSPFENGLIFWFQYIPFILGKIFIAYGIYQTIVSFRKFRL
ncbi:pentapeptide repeat-containing protein [Maribacter sp. 2-571]|uniref:pentapeptide repeat-containing protein n=1 Tax=Maribacter sp. 2-571 TaxID=3417569 RepID=UPI003D33F342